MEVCLFVEPHRGADYEAQLTSARHAEQCGFTGFFRADHYQSFGPTPGLPGPSDAWVTLGALARDTTRIRLGTLVSPVTFRPPGPLSVIVAQVDRMSGGRVELGLGAGWYEREHRSFGLPFPPARERLDQLAEQVQILTGLWRTPPGERFDFDGVHYRLAASPALPKPAQRPGPPIIIGGRGEHRTPRLAARYADEFNAVFLSPEAASHRFRLVDEACWRVGRADTGRAPIRKSAGVPTACGRTAAEVRRRRRHLTEPLSALPAGEAPLAGPPAMLVDRIGELQAAGAHRVYLRLGDLADLAHLDLIAAEVLSAFAD